MTQRSNGSPSAFRLRFDEGDLALSDDLTVIGRDPACTITFVDSMVSRRHASIRLDGGAAILEDLDSRNGTRVNGVLISGPHTLREGDRIGIGSHALMLSAGDPGEAAAADTASMHVCPRCQSPRTQAACLVCGWLRPAASQVTKGEETAQARWSLGMLLEMLGKAMLAERVSDADRVMREAATFLEEQLGAGKTLDLDELHTLTEVIKWLVVEQGNDTWARWLDGILARSSGTTQPPNA